LSLVASLTILGTQINLDGKTISGDNKQLPPVAPSHTAAQNPHGAYCSLSLLAFTLGQNLWTQVFTLVENFRSHPDIVRFVSVLLFKGLLVTSPTSTAMHLHPTAVAVYGALMSGLGVGIFHDVPMDQRVIAVDVESLSCKSPYTKSTFNPGGVNAITDMVRQLLVGGVPATDIAVLTQSSEDKVKLLEKATDFNVAYSTVDAYEGQERRVVVHHMVTARNPTKVTEHYFGHVKDWRRMCVALSRGWTISLLLGHSRFGGAQLREGHWMRMCCVS
jgi:superfamily I DNA and/or RNA helicase